MSARATELRASRGGGAGRDAARIRLGAPGEASGAGLGGGTCTGAQLCACRMDPGEGRTNERKRAEHPPRNMDASTDLVHDMTLHITWLQVLS